LKTVNAPTARPIDAQTFRRSAGGAGSPMKPNPAPHFKGAAHDENSREIALPK